MIEKVVSDNKFKEALQVVVNGKHKQDVKDSFSDGQWKTFEHLYDLIKPENKDKLEAEIKEAQHNIEEAKRRQASYEKQKKDNEKRKLNNNESLEELKKNKNAIKNYISNKQAVD